MNRNFDFYLINIKKTQHCITNLEKNKISEFYKKYKDIYEFDDLMNINCQNCENSFCCINCKNCKYCVFCEDCKNCIECKRCQNRQYCYDCKNLKSL